MRTVVKNREGILLFRIYMTKEELVECGLDTDLPPENLIKRIISETHKPFNLDLQLYIEKEAQPENKLMFGEFENEKTTD